MQLSWILMNDMMTFGVGVLTAFIGTWGGAWVIIKRQEAGRKYPRQLLLEILETLKGYDTYRLAENHFNNRSTVEKKAVLVPLKNLGIPLRIDVIDDSYDVEHVHFDDKAVDKRAIEKMCDFVKRGLCDDLFFKEIGADFYNASPKIILARDLAIRFLDGWATQPNTATIADVMRAARVNTNQFQVIEIFYKTVDVIENGNAAAAKIDAAKQNVRNGVFDHLFYWDVRAYENMNSQRTLADTVNRLAVSANTPAAQLTTNAIGEENTLPGQKSG
jgi:hypothetical protein